MGSRGNGKNEKNFTPKIATKYDIFFGAKSAKMPDF